MADKRKPAPALGQLMPPTVAELRGVRENQYERTMVERVCAILGYGPSTRQEMREYYKRLQGEDELNFVGFHEVIPLFPIYFGTCTRANLGKSVTISRLFMGFQRTVLCKDFLALRDSKPDTAPGYTGLIVKWPNLTRTSEAPTGLVVHDRTPPADAIGTWLTVRVMRLAGDPTGRKAYKPLTLFIQRLDQLVEDIKQRIKSERGGDVDL